MNETEENKETVEVKPDDVVEANGLNAKTKQAFRKYKVESILAQLSLLIIVGTYLLLGFFAKGPWGPYNLSGWAFWWILFLAVPAASQTYAAIRRRKLAAVPIAEVVIVAYLCVGLLTGLWHPYWALFFIIPVYYSLINVRK